MCRRRAGAVAGRTPASCGRRPAGEGAGGFLHVVLGVVADAEGEQLHAARGRSSRWGAPRHWCRRRARQHGRVLGHGGRQRREVARAELAKELVLPVHERRDARPCRCWWRSGRARTTPASRPPAAAPRSSASATRWTRATAGPRSCCWYASARQRTPTCLVAPAPQVRRGDGVGGGISARSHRRHDRAHRGAVAGGKGAVVSAPVAPKPARRIKRAISPRASPAMRSTLPATYERSVMNRRKGDQGRPEYRHSGWPAWSRTSGEALVAVVADYRRNGTSILVERLYAG